MWLVGRASALLRASCVGTRCGQHAAWSKAARLCQHVSTTSDAAGVKQKESALLQHIKSKIMVGQDEMLSAQLLVENLCMINAWAHADAPHAEHVSAHSSWHCDGMPTHHSHTSASKCHAPCRCAEAQLLLQSTCRYCRVAPYVGLHSTCQMCAAASDQCSDSRNHRSD